MLQLACELGASIQLANDMLRKTGFLNTYWEHVKVYPVSGHMAQRCQNRIMPSDGKIHPTLRRIEGEVERACSQSPVKILQTGAETEGPARQLETAVRRLPWVFQMPAILRL